MELVEKPGTVLAKAASMWAVYGGIAVLVVDYAAKWLQSDASAGLSPAMHDILLGVCLIAAPVLRIIRQRSISGPSTPPSPLLRE